MLCQFSREGDKQTLANLDYKFPIDVYPVGRLDEDSEGILLLTNDKKVNNLLLDPAYAHKRTYLVQVEGSIDDVAAKKLRDGILIRIDKKDHKCLKTQVEIIPEPLLPARNPPIRFRKSIPTSWIRITLTEGKNRQVRRMTAATGFPALRLVRSAIEGLDIGKMQVGDVVELSSKDVYKILNIKK